MSDRKNRVYLDRVLASGDAVDEAVKLLRGAGVEVGRDGRARWFTNRRDPRVMAWLAFLANEQDEMADRAESVARYGY